MENNENSDTIDNTINDSINEITHATNGSITKVKTARDKARTAAIAAGESRSLLIASAIS